MMILTTKLTKKKLIAIVAVAAALLCILIIFAGRSVSTSKGLEESTETVEKTISYKNISTNEDRIAFLASCGWAVKEEPLESQEVRIPTEFNEVYQRYNELQVSQSFDLTKYSGKRVKRYTYEITNYPTGEEGVLATILVYKKTIIGGDVMSSRLDGFMHGLDISCAQS